MSSFTESLEHTDLSSLYRPVYRFSINGVPAKVTKVEGDVVTITARLDPCIRYFKPLHYKTILTPQFD